MAGSRFALKPPQTPLRVGHAPCVPARHRRTTRDARVARRWGRIRDAADADERALGARVETIEPPGFFGELALVRGATRAASCVAVARVETLELRRSTLRRLLRQLLFDGAARGGGGGDREGASAPAPAREGARRLSLHRAPSDAGRAAVRRATTVAGYLGALGHLVSHAARLIPLEPSARCRTVAVADLRQAFKDLVREEGVVVDGTLVRISAPAAPVVGRARAREEGGAAESE